MPESAKDSVRKDALYPDELPGSVMRIRDHEKLNGEVEFWNADDPDDAADLPDDGSADHGRWLPVEHSVHGDVWVAAPRTLREQFVELGLEVGDTFEITDVMRGPNDHDPYEMAVHVAHGDGS